MTLTVCARFFLRNIYGQDLFVTAEQASEREKLIFCPKLEELCQLNNALDLHSKIIIYPCIYDAGGQADG